MIELDKIYNEDCLIGMQRIPDGSVDCIICDLPYGTTACAWDTIIPFEPLWEQYKRVIKPNGAIVLFGSQPFTSKLILSNEKMFKYEMIWEKTRGGNSICLGKQPFKVHENICVFYEKMPTFNEQKWKIADYYVDKRKSINDSISYSEHQKEDVRVIKRHKDDGFRHSQTILPFESYWSKDMHPTQKPVDLLRYLIRTYTNEGETILDNCMGSGTTAIACIREKRNFIGFELDEEYWKKACERVKNELSQPTLF